jgi:hypothetical protein
MKNAKLKKPPPPLPPPPKTDLVSTSPFGSAAIISASSQPWPSALARSPSLVPTYSTRVRVRNVSSTGGGGMPTIGELHQVQRTQTVRGSSNVQRTKSLYVQRRRDSAAVTAESAVGRPSRLDRRKLYPGPGTGVNGIQP